HWVNHDEGIGRLHECFSDRFKDRPALVAKRAWAAIFVRDNLRFIPSALRVKSINCTLKIGSKALTPALPYRLWENKVLPVELILDVESRVRVAQQVDAFATECIEAHL